MTKDEIVNLLDELNRNRGIATMNPSDIPFNNRAAWEMARRQSQDSLLELEHKYVLALQEHSVVLSIFGEAKDCSEFARIAREEGVPLIVDVGDLYGKIAQRVEQSLSRELRTWGVTQHSLVLELALNLAVDLGLKEIIHDTTKPFVPISVPTAPDTLARVKSTLRTCLGDTIPAAYTRKLIRESALKQQLVPEKTVGVLIIGASDAVEAGELIKGWPSASHSVIEAPASPTVEFVVRSFRKIKKTKETNPKTKGNTNERK